MPETALPQLEAASSLVLRDREWPQSGLRLLKYYVVLYEGVSRVVHATSKGMRLRVHRRGGLREQRTHDLGEQPRMTWWLVSVR